MGYRRSEALVNSSHSDANLIVAMGSIRDPFAGLVTVDDLIRRLADEEDVNSPPLLAFPKQSKDADGGYDYFNGKDLDRLVEGAAQEYLAQGLPLQVCTRDLEIPPLEIG